MLKTIIYYLAFFFYQGQSTSEIIYPRWFIFPVKGTIVGYSNIDKSSLENAAKRKAILDSCIAVGSLYYYEVSGDNDFNKNSNYFYYYSANSFEFYKERLFPLDSFVVNVLNSDKIILFAYDSLKNFNNNIVAIDTLRKPAWIDSNIIEDRDYYYSVGNYTSIGADNDAWYGSEENALFNLAKGFYHKFGSVQFNIQQNDKYEYEKLIEYRIKTLMKNLEIVARYPDISSKMYYTLIRIKKENLKSFMEK